MWLWLVLIFVVLPLRAAEVLHVTWPTACAAPAATLAPTAASMLPAFRLSMAALPESSIVALALGQPAVLGLTRDQAERLQPLIAEQYRLLGKAPEYQHAHTALPYCFAPQKPTKGLASVYVPTDAGPKSPVILFLHGYGGSFLWYQYYLSSAFPNHLIICPAYGIGSENLPPPYMAECMAAVSKQLGFPLKTPALIGLSAGGFSGSRLYAATPRLYNQFICLAAFPPQDVLNRFLPGRPLRFMVGGAEPFVTSGDFQRSIARVRATGASPETVLVPGGDHFFMLTHREETVNRLRQWLKSGVGE